MQDKLTQNAQISLNVNKECLAKYKVHIRRRDGIRWRQARWRNQRLSGRNAIFPVVVPKYPFL